MQLQPSHWDTAIDSFGQQPLSGKHYAWLYLGAFLLLCLRTPFELVHGFVYDEEGTVYLRYAWDTGAWRALMAPHQGYYSLLANASGVIAARILPLSQAGHFFFWTEIAVQMLLVYMVVQCECFHTYPQKAIAVGLALLTPPTEAVALSTIHAQFFLAVMTGVILVSNAERLRRPRLLALLLAGLTGMTSCVFVPFFIIQAWKERTPARIAQARLLIACTLVQLVYLYRQPGILHGSHSTFGFYSASLLANGVLYHFFSHASLVEVCKAAGSPKLDHWRGLWWLSVEIATAISVVAILALTLKGGRSARTFTLAAVLSLAVSFKRSGAIDGDLMCGSGGRYFFVFNVLVGFSLLLMWSRHSNWRSRMAGLLVAGCLISGVIDLRMIYGRQHFPVWADEVALWRENPEHRLELKPGYWPGVRLAPQRGSAPLPAAIYDTTTPGWRER